MTVQLIVDGAMYNVVGEFDPIAALRVAGFEVTQVVVEVPEVKQAADVRYWGLSAPYNSRGEAEKAIVVAKQVDPALWRDLELNEVNGLYWARHTEPHDIDGGDGR